MRLTDIARETGLSLPTTGRLLAAMAAERLVEADDSGKIWKLGPELVYMGLSASRQHPLVRQASPHVEALALETGDAAYLTVASGDDTVCVFRAVGSHPAQAYTTHIGSRRPMGIGAGGLALLAALPGAEIDGILRRNATKLAGYRHVTPAALRSAITVSRKHGYTYTENHLSGGVHAMGMVVRAKPETAGRSDGGVVIAAVSVSAIAARLSESRRARVAKLIRQAASRIASDLETTGIEE
jgi:DNA-binding IclR family transcriptional regulator